MNSRESLSATCKVHVGLSNSYVEGLCLFKSKIINRDIYKYSWTTSSAGSSNFDLILEK